MWHLQNAACTSAAGCSSSAAGPMGSLGWHKTPCMFRTPEAVFPQHPHSSTGMLDCMLWLCRKPVASGGHSCHPPHSPGATEPSFLCPSCFLHRPWVLPAPRGELGTALTPGAPCSHARVSPQPTLRQQRPEPTLELCWAAFGPGTGLEPEPRGGSRSRARPHPATVPRQQRREAARWRGRLRSAPLRRTGACARPGPRRGGARARGPASAVPAGGGGAARGAVLAARSRGGGGRGGSPALLPHFGAEKSDFLLQRQFCLPFFLFLTQKKKKKKKNTQLKLAAGAAL